MQTKRQDCERCGGKGYINFYNHVSRGLCFGCQGKGEKVTKEQSAAEEKAMWERNTHEQAEMAVQDMRARWYNPRTPARALEWLGKLAELDRAKAIQLFRSLPQDRQQAIRAAKTGATRQALDLAT